MPTHWLYIDDSGTKEYAESPAGYSDRGGRSRYFVFAGFFSTTSEGQLLADKIIKLKKRIFGTDDVEIKGNWLSFKEKRERYYLRKYKISDGDLTSFEESIYRAIAYSRVTLIASIVDKIQIQKKYKYPDYTPAIAYDFLCQRVVQERLPASSIRVVIDDMDGKTPKGRDYRDNLRTQHKKLLTYGTRYRPGVTFAPLMAKQIFFDSAKSNALQVADLIAYNVHKQFRLYGREWDEGDGDEDGTKHLPMHPNFARITRRFKQGPAGRIQGYGIVKAPKLPGGPQWCVIDKKKTGGAS